MTSCICPERGVYWGFWCQAHQRRILQKIIYKIKNFEWENGFPFKHLFRAMYDLAHENLLILLIPGTLKKMCVNLMISPFHSWSLQGLQCKTYTLWCLITFPNIKNFRACFKTVIPEFLDISQSLITNCWYTLTKLTLVAVKTTGAYASEICPCVDTRSTIQARSRRTDVYFLY